LTSAGEHREADLVETKNLGLVVAVVQGRDWHRLVGEVQYIAGCAVAADNDAAVVAADTAVVVPDSGTDLEACFLSAGARGLAVNKEAATAGMEVAVHIVGVVLVPVHYPCTPCVLDDTVAVAVQGIPGVDSGSLVPWINAAAALAWAPFVAVEKDSDSHEDV
jgi:hypothetical protein